MTEARPGWVMAWGMVLGLVVAGELLPGGSAPMRLVARLPVGGFGLHFLAYALLGALAVMGFAGRWVAASAAALVGAGAGLEVLQSFVPGRAAEWGDVVVNAAGVAVGVGVGWMVRLMGRRAG